MTHYVFWEDAENVPVDERFTVNSKANFWKGPREALDPNKGYVRRLGVDGYRQAAIGGRIAFKFQYMAEGNTMEEAVAAYCADAECNPKRPAFVALIRADNLVIR